MKTPTAASSVSNVDITVGYAEHVGQNTRQTTRETIIIREKYVSKESGLTSTLLLAAGVLFWAHGSASHDAWFKGEKVTGQAITGFYIALVGLMCCCCCVAACAAANSHDSEVDDSSDKANRAKQFFTIPSNRQLNPHTNEAEECLKMDSYMTLHV